MRFVITFAVLVQLTLTGYCLSRQPTAAGTRVRPGVIALSRDMLQEYGGGPFAFHDSVVVPGVGGFRVEDTMHHKWRARGDIWFPSKALALEWGRQKHDVQLVQWSPETDPPEAVSVMAVVLNLKPEWRKGKKTC